MRHRQKAFTLVELLLVVIAVVILSSMVMLASGEAETSAKATKIVNTLSNLKMFAITWYNKNMNKFDKDGKFHENGLKKEGKTLQEYFSSNSGKEEIDKFLTGTYSIDYTKRDSYSIVTGKLEDGKIGWFACYYLENKNTKERDRIKKKLENKAKNNKGGTDKKYSYTLFQESSGKWQPYVDGEKVYLPILALDY